MVLNISEGGLLLDSSAKAMAGLPSQAFAIQLSGSDIEDMIACVQNGGGLQLSMGSNPRFLFDDHEVRIPKFPDPSGYDLFHSHSENPSSVTKLPNPTMSILDFTKQKPNAKVVKAPKGFKGSAKGEAPVKPAPLRASTKPKDSTPSHARTPDTNLDAQNQLDDDIANIQNSYAKRQGESKTTIINGLVGSKGGKVRSGKRLLEAQAAALPRPLPPSPGLSGTRSPSIALTANAAQEKAKQQRFPIIHELAVQELSWPELLAKWDEGTEEEFSVAVNKVADFDNNLHKFALSKMHWRELDVFEYPYATEEDRQKAVNNAIKQYDRMRLATSDPLWQKLLPKSERGKGISLSKLQANIVKGPTGPALKSRPDAASISGGDSEKDDSAASGATKKTKGGEPMSRSSSQTSTGRKKLSASEAQAKRLLSTSKKPAAPTVAKPSPKIPPAKAGAKPAGSKMGRVLSKEFVSESSSDDDEAPLSKTMAKSKPAAGPAPKPAERVVGAPKREAPALKPRPAPAARSVPRENEKDTIRAQGIAKPTKPTKLSAKRPRDTEDEDSSSSGTPLSKRVKAVGRALPAPAAPVKSRTASDASQNGRGVAVPKAKNLSSIKSSPLASSPPTNASDLERDRRLLGAACERDRGRQHDRDTTVSSTESDFGAASKKRAAAEPLDGPKAKRPRPSQDTMDKASKFRQFYARYEQLHHEIAAVENPDPSKVTDLLDMRDRLSRMKEEIYASIEV
ncbi:hypothetical protein BT67DRAFT_183056 [Trichocladium antarcticum]|uniref:E3 ubiquitin-protein ligase n=1 Tax=Trichocladium antarcticum TaxID=1450529 RepID=A0AAN6ZG30_9PEZI|nr:hypothetical protein BT67DRAFT_183056 [Trichocladium antarcticum]